MPCSTNYANYHALWPSERVVEAQREVRHRDHRN
jgi:hypothetical protein